MEIDLDEKAVDPLKSDEDRAKAAICRSSSCCFQISSPTVKRRQIRNNCVELAWDSSREQPQLARSTAVDNRSKLGHGRS